MNTKSFAVAALAAMVSLSSASTFAFAQGGGDGGRAQQEFYEVVRHDYRAERAPTGAQTVSMKREVAAPAAPKAQPALVWDADENNG